MSDFIRHGDVKLERVEVLPKSLKKLKTKVIEWGEITGHAHELVGLATLYETNDKTMYLEVPYQTPIRHPEHNTLIIEPGTYKKTVEREYDYVEEILRKVVD